MKRNTILSCLMTLVAVLFMGTTFAQNVTGRYGTWPTTADLATTGATDFVVVDSLYTCADTLHAVELGYDVPGLNLDPKYGTWSLKAYISYGDGNDKAGDYSISAAKNGGAGNVFNLPAAYSGAYFFEYVSENADMCNLSVGKKVGVMIFILPRLGSGLSQDTLFCKPKVAPFTFTPPAFATFFKYQELFTKAALTVTFSEGGTAITQWGAMNSNRVFDTVYKAQVSITGPAVTNGLYTCGKTDSLRYRVQIVDSLGYSRLTKVICDATEVKTLKSIFGRVIGDYKLGATPVTMLSDLTGQWGTISSGQDNGNKYVILNYSYTECGGTVVTLQDSLIWKLNGQLRQFKADTVTYCRTNVPTLNLYELYNLGWNSIAFPQSPLTVSNAEWSDRGVSKFGTAIAMGPKGSAFVSPDSISLDNVAPNKGYWFQYTMLATGNSGTDCFVGDSGALVFMVTDPFKAKDYRFQVCGASSFDLKALTGINTNSFAGTNGLTVTNGVADLTNVPRGTYKVSYSHSAGCGAGSGLIYLKVGGDAVIAKNITEKFCQSTAPGTINLFEIIGYYGNVTAGSANNWSITGGSITASVSDLNVATGEFDLSAYSTTGTIIFTLNNPTCSAAGPITLTIELVSSL